MTKKIADTNFVEIKKEDSKREYVGHETGEEDEGRGRDVDAVAGDEEEGGELEGPVAEARRGTHVPQMPGARPSVRRKNIQMQKKTGAKHLNK